MFAQKTSGGASETVATYENSRTGLRQLSVGRHIGDRYCQGVEKFGTQSHATPESC